MTEGPTGLQPSRTSVAAVGDDQRYEQQPWHCATCGFPLDRRTALEGGGRVEYEHSQAVLRGALARERPVHPVDAVPLQELAREPRFLCDFCSSPDAVWVYAMGEARVTRTMEAARQVVTVGDYWRRHHAARTRLVGTTGAEAVEDWGGNWTACEACAAVLEVGDLMGMLRRLVELLPTRMTNSPGKLAGVRAELLRTHEHTFAGMLRTPAGQPLRARITREYPLGDWETAARQEVSGGDA